MSPQAMSLKNKKILKAICSSNMQLCAFEDGYRLNTDPVFSCEQSFENWILCMSVSMCLCVQRVSICLFVSVYQCQHVFVYLKA